MANISIDKTKWLEKIKHWVLENKKDLRGLCVFTDDEDCYLLYQSKINSNTDFCLAKSNNGLAFELVSKDCSIQNLQGYFENINTIFNPDISKKLKTYNFLYSRQKVKDSSICLAKSNNLISFKDQRIIKNIDKLGVIVKNYKHKDQYVMYSGYNDVKVLFSKDLYKWQTSDKIVLIVRDGMFDSDLVRTVLSFNYKNLLLNFYLAKNSKQKYSLGLAVFSQKDPQHLIWRCSEPIWCQPEDWKKEKFSLIGVTYVNKKIISYWNYQDFGIYAISHPFSLVEALLQKDHLFLKLTKPITNPLISPNQKNDWEAFCTFNPAALYEDGKVHLIYRAQGFDYISVLGYASSTDGVTIDERLDYPIYLPSEKFECVKDKKARKITYKYISAGYGGAEDPRITKIEDRVYMTYVAFDGSNPPRIALTSIRLEDFLAKRWLWEKPVLISPPGVVNKNCVIFPEKINGKYVIFHRIFPNILIDYVDDLNFDGQHWLEGHYQITPRPEMWDSKKVGAGAPPIKTNKGWLFIYQAVGNQDGGKYKIGAMLLDLNRPERVLYRSNQPILEPDQWYENHGFKPGVAYPCGAVVINDTLYVYYGGADSHVCVAKASLSKFISDLTTVGNPKLEPSSIHKIL